MGFPWIVYLGLATAKVNPISGLATGKLAKRLVLPRTAWNRNRNIFVKSFVPLASA